MKKSFHIESYRYRTINIIFNITTQQCTLRVSTVFISDEYGYETCVFDANGSDVVARYDTEDEAILGHHDCMREYRLTNLKVFE